MATDTSAGATFSWQPNGGSDAVIAEVMSIDRTQSAKKIDVTTLGSSTKLYEVGLNDIGVTIKLVGLTTLDIGDKGQITISPNDAAGTSDITMANMVVMSIPESWPEDDAITTTVEFAPSTADAA